MTAPLTYFKYLLILVLPWLLSACHSSSNSPSKIPEINTLNIYTADQKIYSFNEETGASTIRAEFDGGSDFFLELDLDESKQGYEYAIYADNNTINILNYDKAANNKPLELAEISNSFQICRLIPHKTASEKAFEDRISSNRSEIDLPVITVEYQNINDSCDPESNLRDQIHFQAIIENRFNTKDIRRVQGTSNQVLGDLIIYYSGKATSLEKSFTQYDNNGFLGQNIASNQLTFEYVTEEEDNRWDADFFVSNGIQSISQVSRDKVLVQQDTKLFVINTESLFEINNASDSNPIQDKIDALLSSETKILDPFYPISLNNSPQETNFLIGHNNRLYYFDDSELTLIPANESLESQNATKLSHALTSNQTAIVLQEANGIQTLLSISTVSGQSSTLISAEEIEYYIIENDLYINTLNSQSGSGWQAHWFKPVNNAYSIKTFSNSRLIFSGDSRNKANSLFLLATEEDTSSGLLESPNLYFFDRSKTNGRKKGQNSSQSSVDFNLGQLSTNVTSILSSKIINDRFGMISLRGINGDSGSGQAVEEIYYFDPSQKEADPTIKDQSLKLMYREFL